MPDLLVADPFLAEILERPAWRLTQPAQATKEMFGTGSYGFVHAKMQCVDNNAINALENCGFHLVDTNTQLDRPNDRPWPNIELAAEYDVRFAEPGDATAVEHVATTSFTYTRFHLDPQVPNEAANEIKRRWAGNYFRGHRGDWMVVSTWRDKPVGFLQLLSRDNTIVIDLIAVDSEHQGKGLATAMIESAARECGNWQRMLVGTQISNIPSIRAYEKLGFRMCDSSYVFHYHGPITKTG